MQSDWALGEKNYLIAGYEFNRDGLDADTNTYSNMSIPINAFMIRKINSQTHYKYEGYMDTHALYGLMETKLPWDLTLNYGVRQT